MSPRQSEVQDQTTTADADAHGGSAGRRDVRRAPEGEIRTQRGHREDVAPEVYARGYEAADVAPRKVAFALAGFVVAIVLSVAAVAGVLRAFRAMQPAPSVDSLAARHALPPQPRLEVAPGPGRVKREGQAIARLNEYGWADRAAGRARIPIERAFELLAAHGWPDADPQAPGPGAQP